MVYLLMSFLWIASNNILFKFDWALISVSVFFLLKNMPPFDLAQLGYWELRLAADWLSPTQKAINFRG